MPEFYNETMFPYRDVNFGLVKQVKVVQTKLNIQRLTKTFLTLSLADLAARVQLSGGAQQAEKLILAMVCRVVDMI